MRRARQLAERSYLVFLAARRREAGEKAAAALHRSGAQVTVVALAAADEQSIRNAAREVAARVDHLNMLVNNAAVLDDENLSVLETGAATLQRVLVTNTIGPLLVAQAFLPLLTRSQGGRIINVSSSAGSLNEMETYAPPTVFPKQR